MKTLKEMVEREFGTSVEVIDLGSWGGGEGGERVGLEEFVAGLERFPPIR